MTQPGLIVADSVPVAPASTVCPGMNSLEAAARSDNNFDLLRLIAAVFVLIGHIEYPYFDIQIDIYARLVRFQSLGGLGVAIFFVISGYLIYQSRERTPSLLAYFRKRALRIFPGLIACIVLLAIVGFAFSNLTLSQYVSSPQFGPFLLNMLVFPLNPCVTPLATTYVYGCNLTGAIWTLSYEFMMYLMIGILGFCAPRTRIYILAAFFCIIVALIMHDVLAKLGHYTLAVKGVTLFQFMADRGAPLMALFAAGALLNLLPRTVLMRWDIATFAAILYLASGKTNPALHLTIQSIALPFIIICIGLHRWRIAGFVERIGDLSYGIFIYHWPVMTFTWILLNGRMPTTLMALVVAVVTGALAFLSYHLVERPALRLK